MFKKQFFYISIIRIKLDIQKIVALYSINKSDKSVLNITFYLSTPPSSYKDIISNIIKSDLNKENLGYSRIVIEKPFGQNLGTAKKLNQLLKSGFNESQIYRIDHYLGKETVQNI